MDISPKVSVVVVTKNEELSIRACLESLLIQTYVASEIIVVDAGSMDQTQVIVRSYAPKVTLLVETGGIGAQRMAGVRAATGTHVAFIDSDCVASPEWLARFITAWDHENSTLAGIGGPHSSPTHTTTVGNLICILKTSPLGCMDPKQVRVEERSFRVDHIPGVNGFFLRAAYLRVQEPLGAPYAGEDSDVSIQLGRLGYTLQWLASNPVAHSGPTSIREWIHTVLRYGQSRMVLIIKYPTYHIQRWKYWIPGVCLLLWVLSLVWFPAFALGSVVCYLFLLFLHSLALTSFRYIPLLLILFGITHIGYALGLWKGLLRLRSN